MVDVKPILVVGECRLLGLPPPASRGPDLGWDSRRALHKSPPNDLDCHAHQAAGLSIMSHNAVNVGPSTSHLSSSPVSPVVIMLDVFGDSIMDSFHVVL